MTNRPGMTMTVTRVIDVCDIFTVMDKSELPGGDYEKQRAAVIDRAVRDAATVGCGVWVVDQPTHVSVVVTPDVPSGQIHYQADWITLSTPEDS